MGGGESPKEYLTFEDVEVWRICCENWGDYNEIVITDNGDNTVDIATTPVHMEDTTSTRGTTITQYNVDNTGGTYTAGTTKEAVGITKEQCEVVTAIGKDNTSGTTPFTNNSLIVKFNELSYFKNLTIMGRHMFYNCSNLKEFTIPGSVTVLGSYAFSTTPSVETVWCYPTAAPTLRSNVFGQSSSYMMGKNHRTDGTNKFHVPNGATGYTSGVYGGALINTSTGCGFTVVYDL